MGYVDKSVALKYLANSEKLFDRLKNNFLESNKNTLDDITNCVANNDVEGLHQIVHSIKGISLNLGSMPLYDDSIALLEKIKKGEISIPLLEQFIDTFRNVYNELSRL